MIHQIDPNKQLFSKESQPQSIVSLIFLISLECRTQNTGETDSGILKGVNF